MLKEEKSQWNLIALMLVGLIIFSVDSHVSLTTVNLSVANSMKVSLSYKFETRIHLSLYGGMSGNIINNDNNFNHIISSLRGRVSMESDPGRLSVE